MRFYTREQLGPKQSLTPEGFLVCHDVAIARTGTQLYSPIELPLDPGHDGLIKIVREEKEVFREETRASYEGKSVTVDHPDDFVGPDNWKELTVGVAQNVRRGLGIENDLLIADLLITDADAIKAVRGGLREVSCGYDAEYEQQGPGTGFQRNIVGNHVALVERGRAGPRCSIQDKEGTTMAKKSFKDKLLAMFSAKDADELKAAMADAESDEDEDDKKEKKTADSLASLTKTVDSLVKAVAALATKDADGDDEDEEKKKQQAKDDAEALEKQKANDTIIEAEAAEKAEVGTTFTGDASRAEILCPGYTTPTKDSVTTKATLVAFRRSVLTKAMQTADGKAAIEPFLDGRTVDKLTPEAVGAVFIGAAQVMKQTNNATNTRTGDAALRVKDFGQAGSITAINQAAREFWGNRNNVK